MAKEKLKTLDGERTRVEELNTGPVPSGEEDRGLIGRLKRLSRNLSLVMAGMYTGLTCYGTPNTEHRYATAKEAEKDGARPDKRLI